MKKETEEELEVTDLYDEIWNHFDNDIVKEAVELLSIRLKRNNIPLDILKDKIVLDNGCGSGRYTVALKILGAKEVIGLDMGEGKKISYEAVKYVKGSVESLPFDDNFFDFVFCNGVLHHTPYTKEGIKEIYRVLKPRGWMWLYLCGPSKVWETADTIRKKLNLEDAKNLRKLLEWYLFPEGKQFLILDILFPKIRNYMPKDVLINLLEEYGFKNIRYLERGADFDFTERMYKDPRLKKDFGDVDLRFIAQK
jgi:ubiquinone/menaquinone biosynthesis C-methylase UbiE